MIYIKCLDVRGSKIFYVVSELKDENQILLVDLLIDLKIKMFASSLSDIENQNPFIQDIINIYHFDDNNFDLECARKFIKSDGMEYGGNEPLSTSYFTK